MPSSQPDQTNDFQFLAEMDKAASASTEAAEAEVLTERLLAAFLDSRALQAERLSQIEAEMAELGVVWILA